MPERRFLKLAELSPFQGRTVAAQFIRKDFEMAPGLPTRHCRSFLRHPQIHVYVSNDTWVELKRLGNETSAAFD
jgi:hypothetical protein